MKLFFALFIAFLTTSALFAQKEKPVFDPALLSKEELTNCKLFRDMKGLPRWEVFLKIKHIFPTSEIIKVKNKTTYDKKTVSVIMTKKQLVQLIGKPDFTDGSYELGKRRYDCEVSFVVIRNIILGLMYTNCKDELKKK